MVEKVTKQKDPAAQKRGKKAWETTMENIKKKHLTEINNTTPSDTPNTPSDTPNTPSNTPSNTPNTPLDTNNMVLYGILMVGGGVLTYYFYYQKKNVCQTSNKTSDYFEM